MSGRAVISIRRLAKHVVILRRIRVILSTRGGYFYIRVRYNRLLIPPKENSQFYLFCPDSVV